MINNFSQFKTCNLKGCVERAQDLLIAAKEMQLSHDDLISLARSQMLKNEENGGMWESVAWHLVYLEAFERQIRVEDQTIAPPAPNWNGGFGAPSPEVHGMSESIVRGYENGGNFD